MNNIGQKSFGSCITGYPQIISEWILDLIFPVRCISCSRFSVKKSGYFCKKCLGLISVNSKFECIGCKRRVILGKTCPSCQSSNQIDRLLVVSDYENASVVKIIKTLKYRFIREMAVPISLLIKKYIIWLGSKKKFNILAENPIIVPVPLHRRRLNWRGFNQADLIATSLSEVLNCDIQTSTLTREMMTKPQADIQKRETRLENIKEAFKLADMEEIKDRTILLVDDVCTTGATLNECAKVLKEHGALKVIGLVFARG